MYKSITLDTDQWVLVLRSLTERKARLYDLKQEARDLKMTKVLDAYYEREIQLATDLHWEISQQWSKNAEALPPPTNRGVNPTSGEGHNERD